MKTSVADRIRQRLEQFTEALESGATIQEHFTVRKVELNLKPKHYDPTMVVKTRNLLGISQSVFALLLGVSTKTVQAWEQGQNPPKNVSCRFMDEFRHNPQYWIDRLKEASQTQEEVA